MEAKVSEIGQVRPRLQTAWLPIAMAASRACLFGNTLSASTLHPLSIFHKTQTTTIFPSSRRLVQGTSIEMPDRVCYTSRLLEESKQRGLALVNWAPFYPSVKDLELDIRKQLDLQSFPLPRSVGIKQKKFRANVVTAIAEELLASRRTALNPAKLSAFPGTQGKFTHKPGNAMEYGLS